MGYNDGNYITLYNGVIDGKISYDTKNYSNFGFDNYFQPNGSDKTLADLDFENKKDSFSARKKAIDNFISKNSKYKFLIKDIPEWKGSYQK